MILQDAKRIAEKYKAQLEQFCCRVEIAGSVRREKPEVHDIEIVCIPKGSRLREFVDWVNQFYALKGKAIGKYTRRTLPEGIALDLFITTEDKWGLIFAIRTGSADYSHKVLANGWVKKGYKSKDGILHDEFGCKVFIKEEKDLFLLLNMKFVEPRLREV